MDDFRARGDARRKQIFEAEAKMGEAQDAVTRRLQESGIEGKIEVVLNDRKGEYMVRVINTTDETPLDKAGIAGKIEGMGFERTRDFQVADRAFHAQDQNLTMDITINEAAVMAKLGIKAREQVAQVR